MIFNKTNIFVCLMLLSFNMHGMQAGLLTEREVSVCLDKLEKDILGVRRYCLKVGVRDHSGGLLPDLTNYLNRRKFLLDRRTFLCEENEYEVNKHSILSLIRKINNKGIGEKNRRKTQKLAKILNPKFSPSDRNFLRYASLCSDIDALSDEMLLLPIDPIGTVDPIQITFGGWLHCVRERGYHLEGRRRSRGFPVDRKQLLELRLLSEMLKECGKITKNPRSIRVAARRAIAWLKLFGRGEIDLQDKFFLRVISRFENEYGNDKIVRKIIENEQDRDDLIEKLEENI